MWQKHLASHCPDKHLVVHKSFTWFSSSLCAAITRVLGPEHAIEPCGSFVVTATAGAGALALLDGRSSPASQGL